MKLSSAAAWQQPGACSRPRPRIAAASDAGMFGPSYLSFLNDKQGYDVISSISLSMGSFDI